MLQSAKNTARATLSALQGRLAEAASTVAEALRAATLGLAAEPVPVPVRVRDRRPGRIG
ncbi:hypothetical protein MKK69_22455 [Methylobacterium sp. J-026]|uniref:hypothetical protein n=1 Tax=Methylobacterium sp. J-026 TaxID=2836624 RepID=UPI001FB9245A|nr:hypothetical protein [Methylobacterium sp. J-026]MCJ2136776.1 hypothetical protein [Methylobacterium sp. J-026]